jgi:hypothetical protein
MPAEKCENPYARQIISPVLFFMELWIWIDICRTYSNLLLNSWLMKKDSVAISNKMVQLHILQTIQGEQYEKCSMTESSVRNCLRDHLFLAFVIFIYGTALKGKCTRTTLTLLKPSRMRSGMWLLGLQHVSKGFFQQCEVCLRADDDHFKPFM